MLYLPTSCQSGFNYSVNNHHVVTAVLQEANLKMGTDPVLKRVALHFNTYDKKRPKSL
jgi:hypothetical protein